MKNILFPTDFSENSLQAFPYALNVAYLFQARLILFNSFSMPYSKSNVLVSIEDKLREDAIKSLNELQSSALSQRKYADLTIQVEIRHGDFVGLITKVASEYSVDYIVMGTKGASGLKEMFIGSNTLEVIHLAGCPVLAVPEKAGNDKVNQIAMAIDLKQLKNPDKLRPLFEMAKICRSLIEFVHILQPQEEGNMEDKAKEAINLMGIAEDLKVSFHFISNSDIIEGLSEYISERSPGMLGMLSRKHSLFQRIFTKSITNKLSFRSEIPLLVMQE